MTFRQPHRLELALDPAVLGGAVLCGALTAEEGEITLSRRRNGEGALQLPGYSIAVLRLPGE